MARILQTANDRYRQNSTKTNEPMKSPRPKQLLSASFALATAFAFTSCADPYYNAPPSRTSVTTTYRTGYEVRELPSGYRSQVVDGTRYYVYDNTYFRPRRDRYVVVEAPRNARPDHYERHESSPRGRRDVYVDRLPSGYRVVDRDGHRYYRAGDTYYESRGSRYVIVNRPF